MSAIQLPYCPYCGQLDQVRHVRVVALSGTPLAMRVAPPLMPLAVTPVSSCVARLLSPLLGLLAIGAVLVMMLTAMVGTRPPLLSLLVLASPVLALLAVVGLLWVLVRRVELGRHAVQLALYEAEMNAWLEQYYCQRCDDTFVPVAPALAGSYTGQTIRIAP